MSDRKHTEGPWEVRDDVIVGGSGPTIVVYELNTNPADHALIGAAPDLLEALTRIADFTQRGSHVGDIARAAIAKATTP